MFFYNPINFIIKNFFGAEKIVTYLLDIYIIFVIAINKKEDKKSFIIINCKYFMRTLRLLNLHCNKIEDNNSHKLNETFLTVENGLFHIFGPKLMMNGSDWNINADIQFNEQAIMSFFDVELVRNLSTTKYFRNYIVEEKETQDGPKKVNFATTTNTANYVLSYEII